jgi:hypothetical protein
MVDRKLKPMHYALWALAGASLAASTWFLTLIPIPRLLEIGCGCGTALWSDRLRFLGILGPGIIGFVVMIWAEKQLGRGYRSELWSDEDLAPLRAFLTKPLWKRLNWVTLVIYLDVFIYWLRPNRLDWIHLGLIYILLLPKSCVSRMQQVFAPVRKKREGALIDWHNFKPIQSDH